MLLHVTTRPHSEDTCKSAHEPTSRAFGKTMMRVPPPTWSSRPARHSCARAWCQADPLEREELLQRGGRPLQAAKV
jgi:hypothetical protein